MGSNPAQSLNIFSALCSSSVAAAHALMTVITQLLLLTTLISVFANTFGFTSVYKPDVFRFVAILMVRVFRPSVTVMSNTPAL